MSRFPLLCGLALLAFGACSSSEPVVVDEEPKTDDTKKVDTFALEIVGSPYVTLKQRMQATLVARYLKNNEPVAGVTVAFRFVDDALDSGMDHVSVATNHDGLAQTTITAGRIAGRFRVEASAVEVDPVSWSVAVVKDPDFRPTLLGEFELNSQFNIEGDFTGSTVGDMRNLIFEITNDPDDPGKFIVDSIVDEIDNEAVLAVVGFVQSALYKEVNDLLEDVAGDLVEKTRKVGQAISTLSRRFAMRSVLASPAGQRANRTMSVSHRAKALSWNFEGQVSEYTFAELGMQEPVVNGVLITPAATTAGWEYMKLSEHTLPLKYGSFLLVALNTMVIPKLQPNAHSITDLLTSFVDCDSVGDKLNDTARIGGKDLWSSACTAAMAFVGAQIQGYVADLDDSASALTLTGATRVLDKNGDDYFDAFENGIWTGSFTLGDATAPIEGDGNTFTGVRTK